ncbi:endonuclease/exonuclease/phosphatase family protein [Streptomyces sp. B6B3]|uniref:endonuclease/exonuclease/phosphatase family protein n=1 Tax=Streptomyces sp. B6B3 TaxID=3153570 RepID=UPI00325E0755
MGLDVMTYNLKFDDRGTATNNAWTTRRPIMARLLAQEVPHLLGTQEGLYDQLTQIHQDLSTQQQKRRYDWIGEGRGGGSHDEYMAVFYDRDRLVPEEYEHFWIYQDPLTIGRKWDDASGSPRMVTWVLFRDTETKRRFYAINTHLDDQSAASRQASVDLIRKQMNKTQENGLPKFDTGLPCVVTGDFNVPARKGEKVYDAMLKDGRLVDAWMTAKARGPVYATWNDWVDPQPKDDRIDWILVTPKVIVETASINVYRENGQWPSDHCPVQATLTLP